MERSDREILLEALKKRKRGGKIDSGKLEAMIDDFKLLPAPFPYEHLLARIKRDARSERKKPLLMLLFIRKPLMVSAICGMIIALFGFYYAFMHTAADKLPAAHGVSKLPIPDQAFEIVPQHNTKHPAISPVTALNRRELEKWALAKDAALVAYIDEDNLIVSIGKRGTVDALSSSGKTWSYELGSTVTAPLVWGGNVIFCATSDLKVSALSKSSGKLIWSRRLDGRLLFGGGMLYYHGMLFAGTSNGSVYAFSQSGDEIWSRKFNSGIFIPPVAAGKDIIVATNDGKLVHMKMHDGTIASFATTGRIAGMTAGKDGRLYLSAEDGNFICYDYEKKREVWRHATKSRLAQSPIVQNNGIFLFSSSGDVHFFTHDGRPVWKAGLGGTINVRPAIRKGDLYVLAGKALYVLDAKDGGVKWSYVMDSIATTSAVIAEGNIIYGTQEDGVVVLRRN